MFNGSTTGESTISSSSTVIGSKFILFIAQLVLSLTLCAVSLVHLSRDECKNPSLWLTMLSGSIAYLIPNPSVKREREFVDNSEIASRQSHIRL